MDAADRKADEAQDEQPKEQPAQNSAPDGSRLIEPAGGVTFFRPPDSFRNHKPGAPWTPEETEQLEAAFMPLIDSFNRQQAEAPDRELVLASLPGWMYAKLPKGGPITPEDQAAIRAHFAKYYPDLAARVDPMSAIGGYRYGTWYQRSHGREGPTLPPRTARAIELDAVIESEANEPDE